MTLLFVIRAGQILLIHKKRGLGAGKINGPGGRLHLGESPLHGAVREVKEELCNPIEVYRVLRPGGCVLVRTVAPEVTIQTWVPCRFFPKVACEGTARLPTIDVILTRTPSRYTRVVR